MIRERGRESRREGERGSRRKGERGRASKHKRDEFTSMVTILIYV